MAQVRATCNRCGDIELTIDAVTVRLCRDDGDHGYLFACPDCGAEHSKLAQRRTLDLLVANGAEVVVWSAPIERIVTTGLRPLTHDDLLDFHRLLCDDHATEAALGNFVDD